MLVPPRPLFASSLLFALLTPACPLVTACDNAGGPNITISGADDTGEKSPDSDAHDSSLSDSAPADTSDTADSADEPETWPKSCSDVYDPDEVQTFSLDFTPEDWAALQADCSEGEQAYHDVTLGWNDQSVPAMVRLKGNWTWNCDKLQFVVSFNENDSAGRFEGLRKLVLDAPWYDRTMLHERMAFPLFERLGLPYSCANSAQVNINGEYYGLYTSTERLDREYLERNFENPDGNLYQAAAELKTNEDEGDTSDLEALKAARTVDELAALIDLDEATGEWAAEAMLPALDNYWAGVDINYYIYHYPERGFLFLPYDMDLIFGDSVYSDGSPIWSNVQYADPIYWEHTGWYKEQIFKTVLSDRAWCEVYVEKVALARAAYDPVEMGVQLAEWDAQISEAYEADPRKIVSLSEHQSSVASLAVFLQERADFVDDWLAEGGHCPARW